MTTSCNVIARNEAISWLELRTYDGDCFVVLALINIKILITELDLSLLLSTPQLLAMT